MSRLEARLAPPVPLFRFLAADSARRTHKTMPVGTWMHRASLGITASDSVAIAAAIAVTAVITGMNVARLDAVGALGASILIFIGWQCALLRTRTRMVTAPRAGAGELLHVVAASVIVFGALALMIVAFDLPAARSLFTVTLPVGTALLLGERLSWQIWLRARQRAGHGVRTAVVVGDQSDHDYISDRLRRDHAAVTVSRAVTDFEDAAVMADNAEADLIIVMNSCGASDDAIRSLGWRLEGTMADLVFASRAPDVAAHRMRLHAIDGLPLLMVSPARFTGTPHVVKRAFDVIVSAMALIVLTPLMLCLAGVIRLDSDGPALFRQERVGKNGERFTMLKFRSMADEAELDIGRLRDHNEAAGVLFKIHDDPRVTRVGTFIRRHSLDELPQLFNVFRGDMSLVGPRPPLPREVAAYESDVHRRLYIRPGLTGLWQINGRSDLSWDESVRLDLHYVENWSLGGDCVVIAKTARAVLYPVGAY